MENPNSPKPLTKKMHIFVPVLIFFAFTITAAIAVEDDDSTSQPPPLHNLHLLNRLHQNATTPPQEYFEITTPLPTSHSSPSCTLPVLSYSFADTINKPPITANYSAPVNCTWTHVTLELNITSEGNQYDRIAAVWLDGAEILRTSTAEPTPTGIFWTVRKDVTRYSTLLANDDLTLSILLENIVNDIYTGVYKVNVTFYYYNSTAGDGDGNGNGNGDVSPVLSLPSDNSSSELVNLPADLIIPISNIEEDTGFWFRIEKGSETGSVGIQIPLNTYKAVIEIYVSYHGDDEFWYSNPPDSYIELNKLATTRGHSSYREVMLTIDDDLIGSVVPFPVIFTGGINPLFWAPLVSIGAFSLPSYDFDLTPFLGLILDGNVHYFGLSVASSIPYWLVDANLHLWLDNSVTQVQAGTTYKPPRFSIEQEFEFNGLNGEFEIEFKRSSEIVGWVNSTFGNFTTYTTRSLKFENEIEYKDNGKRKTVEQKVKEKSETRILSSNGTLISNSSSSKEYPLKITYETSGVSAANGTYLMNNKVENSVKEVKTENGITTSEYSNSQKCSGWMFVQDHDVVSGSANTEQNYKSKNGNECYSRKVAAYNGKILNDNLSLICQSFL